MEEEFEAMKVFRNHDQILFTIEEGLNRRIISDMKILEDQSMVVLSWSTNLESLIYGRLTKKGLDLRNYLKEYEWE
ncbi:hypothetical protein [Dyadobacter sediminis]|jgi:hypothetical protein|uniref:Uncharacterized protein n=1 Tax=Dyadobacter sediminis TaxID=1493691 RepID=A0A5R9KBR1_9BACT|nr:hypothetical protein [Dyadobacter sediminis]TLU92261.1 hypothetical protein FEM55_16115 [Dyadobacter sediminis]GGB96075.1 hypothetical protein GCM10011325_24230 [Dyadobacter sediminis]